MDTRIKSLLDDLLTEIRKLGIDTSTLVLFGSQSDGTSSDGSDAGITNYISSIHQH
jgi:hypothetical protein